MNGGGGGGGTMVPADWHATKKTSTDNNVHLYTQPNVAVDTLV